MTDYSKTILIPMIEILADINKVQWTLPEREEDQIEMVRTLMTICRPAKLSEAYYALEKGFLTREKGSKTIVPAYDIGEELSDGIFLYKGDITLIEADAIVNAANEKLLGCFVPGHRCIDNAIQMASGLGVRMACSDLMEAQGYDEPAGQVKITSAYNLPSTYILHTVGPNVNGPEKLSWKEVEDQLINCYVSILDEANGHEGIKTLVFCSISTGVYGVPIKMASAIALKTIRHWLDNHHHHLDKVIIDVFSDTDYDTYAEQAKKFSFL